MLVQAGAFGRTRPGALAPMTASRELGDPCVTGSGRGGGLAVRVRRTSKGRSLQRRRSRGQVAVARLLRDVGQMRRFTQKCKEINAALHINKSAQGG